MGTIQRWQPGIAELNQIQHSFPMSTSIEIGFAAESLALEFLMQRGLILRKRNYTCRYGEIDLIMADQDILVFVEVRKRQDETYGAGWETVRGSKRAHLYKAATHYLMTQNLYDQVNCRFDLISINAKDKITWIKAVFEKNYTP